MPAEWQPMHLPAQAPAHTVHQHTHEHIITFLGILVITLFLLPSSKYLLLWVDLHNNNNKLLLTVCKCVGVCICWCICQWERCLASFSITLFKSIMRVHECTSACMCACVRVFVCVCACACSHRVLQWTWRLLIQLDSLANEHEISLFLYLVLYSGLKPLPLALTWMPRIWARVSCL